MIVITLKDIITISMVIIAIIGYLIYWIIQKVKNIKNKEKEND